MQRSLSDSNSSSQLQSTSSNLQLVQSDDDGEEIEIVDENQSEIANDTSEIGNLDTNLDTSGHSIDQSNSASNSSSEDSLQATGIQANYSLSGIRKLCLTPSWSFIHKRELES